MKRTLPFILTFALALAASAVARAEGENLLANGGFEGKLDGWSAMWSRDGAQCVALELANKTQAADSVHSGSHAAHLAHTCASEWTLTSKQKVNVTYEGVYEVSYWARVVGTPNFKVGVVLYDAAGTVLSWDVSETKRTNATNGAWVRVTGGIWVRQERAAYVVVRCTGTGSGEVYVDDIALRGGGRRPLFVDLTSGSGGSEGSVAARVDTQLGTVNVTLPGTGLRWEQVRTWGPRVTELVAYDRTSVTVEISGGYRATISLTEGVPEVVYRISSNGTKALNMFPHPFVSKSGHVVVPVNEGISFPVTAAEEIGTKSYSFASGHGLCMAFWGVVDQTSAGPGYMAIVDTPDDASIILSKREGCFLPYSQWLLQKGVWGYERVVRFRFFEAGGHVRMAKIFREYRKAQGRLVTLRAKLARNPNVDLLVGSPNIWATLSPRAFIPKLQGLGIQRMLWSSATSAANIEFMNNNVSDVLSSRYDIYQDAMDRNSFPNLSYTHKDWTTEAFPDDVVYDSSGDWVRGWGVLGKDGETWYYCGAICDRQALKYARNRTEEELRTKHYRCRFLDTTTASGWRECYHKDHPMTRSESREWRMRLLDYFYSEHNLVVGSETGHEAAVPYLHYFEGMMSLGPYRVKDAGRRMYEVVYDVPEQITRFQLGHAYRLPLWELVYHDCVVAYWYWGDYNNKLPPVWDKRDLFNALYGVPPMYLINQTGWDTYRDRFVQSYNNTVPIARAVGYSEMLKHEFLTEDRDVQQTTFLLEPGRVKKVIVNFGTEAPYRHPGTGATVQPMSYYTYEDEEEEDVPAPPASSESASGSSSGSLSKSSSGDPSSSSSSSGITPESGSKASESKHTDSAVRPVVGSSLCICLLLALALLF